MSFRAFVVGADYNLQFARADAERIADALKNLGYRLTEPRIPPPDENSDSISARLKKFAADSKSDDTLLFYFAGHGVIENGILYLVLDGYIPGRAMETCLMMNTVSGIVQGSIASNKLIILDCCHAGKSFSLADFHADNYAILTASESFEKALEFKDRQAGFLSWHLCNAFAEHGDLAKVAKNSCVTLNALQAYLQNKVDERNRSNPKKVPNIIVVSKQHSEIVLAELADPYLRLSGLVQINRAFFAAERRKSGPDFTPAKFYGALPVAQWWGVASGLLSEQSLFPAIEAHLRQAVDDYAPLIGVIFGSGGMGKSVLLRRLGMALAEEFDVWWLEDSEELLGEREAAEEELLESGRPQLILLDDWTMALQEEERKDFQAWFGRLHKKGACRQLKFVLTARSSTGFSANLLHGGSKSLFDVDKQGDLQRDNPLLLAKAAEALNEPAWAAAAEELRGSNLTQTKPFHLLFVMMRGKEIEKGQNVEGIFEEIIASDMDKLWQDEYRKGLAAAVSTFAFLYLKFQRNITRKALLQLAERSNPEYPLSLSAELAVLLSYYLYSYRDSANKREDAE